MENFTKEGVGGRYPPLLLSVFYLNSSPNLGSQRLSFSQPHLRGYPVLHWMVFHGISKERKSLNNSVQNQPWLLMWYRLLSDFCALQFLLLGRLQPLIALTSSSLLRWKVASRSWCAPYNHFVTKRLINLGCIDCTQILDVDEWLV